MTLPTWDYEAWPSAEPCDWMGGHRAPGDMRDFHVDLGCGRLKKGRIGVDRYKAPGVNVICDLNKLQSYGWAEAPGEDATLTSNIAFQRGLPFADSSVESIISSHCLEHIAEGFIPLMDECYRVLKPGGVFRIIVPLFPSTTAVEDPDHRRYFMERTLENFCGTPGDTPQNCWLASFSVPYTKARFESLVEEKDATGPTPVELRFTDEDRRELRQTLVAMK